MIHEVDESLRLLMKHEALQGADIEVVFDAPTKDWASRRNTPTLDIYLYDVREALPRRHVGRQDVLDAEGRVVERKPPPRWFKLSYLVTAWTQRPEDEHRLLSAVLQAFMKHEHIPDDMLVGSLKDIDLPVQMHIALPPPQDRAISEIWSALGGELKPSLDIVITAGMDSGIIYPVGPLVLETPVFGVRPVEGEDELATRNRPLYDGSMPSPLDLVDDLDDFETLADLGLDSEGEVPDSTKAAEGEDQDDMATRRKRRRKRATPAGHAATDMYAAREGRDASEGAERGPFRPDGSRVVEIPDENDPDEVVTAGDPNQRAGRVFRIQSMPDPRYKDRS